MVENENVKQKDIKSDANTIFLIFFDTFDQFRNVAFLSMNDRDGDKKVEYIHNNGRTCGNFCGRDGGRMLFLDRLITISTEVVERIRLRYRDLERFLK